MPDQVITVRAAYDDEAGVWYVEDSNLPGLVTEARSLEALRAKLPAVVEDIIEANGLDMHGAIPIEVTARIQAVAHA
jgi:hypothetical protein